MSREAPWPVTLPDEQAAPARAKTSQFLMRVSQMIEWQPIEDALAAIPVNAATRPRYPSLLLFKIVLLQQWYGLSDPGAVDAINDRAAFARFIGLPDRAASPSFATISRFRAQLGRRGLGSLIRTVADQLEAKGLEVREGAMVEASLVEIRGRPH